MSIYYLPERKIQLNNKKQRGSEILNILKKREKELGWDKKELDTLPLRPQGIKWLT